MFSVPGVIIQERNTIPPAVASVETAIPVFIGRTADATLANVPTRITTRLEYEQKFGLAPVQPISLNAVKRVAQGSGALDGVTVTLNGTLGPVPDQLMHYAMIAFYDNQGGPCWIYSTGNTAPTQQNFLDAIAAMNAVDEPTLIVCPEAAQLTTAGQTEAVIQAGLNAGLVTKDRFMIGDVPAGRSGGANADASNLATFRGAIAPTDPKALQYGAAYWPYLNTNIPWRTDDAQITLATAQTLTIPSDGSAPGAPADIGGIAADAAITDSSVRVDETAIYNAAKAFVSGLYVMMPPSPFIAGAYATIDANKGVHHAPANIGLNRVSGPAVRVSDVINASFNVDATSGKSVNVIRAFTGRGTRVWGARTLAGNDNEYRYVPVRRLMLMIEESIEKAATQFVFALNDRTTWVQLQTMIENFLFTQWRVGALQGEKPEHAYQVLVGLGVTMTADDILNGILRIVVRVAPVRPAEFIEITFEQMLPSS